MPHDVTMPQLGMAQDAGRLVAWLKAPGDAVAQGEALFEVETDKATMEVEAQVSGYLAGVVAAEGDDVPVGAVIARITQTPGDAQKTALAPPVAAPAAAVPEHGTGDLPEGRIVTMPQLGMAQDSGVLVAWLKQPGDAVEADDLLFEVETDKATMEVEAGHAGYLAATLAQPGDEVAVGGSLAIISAERPAARVTRQVQAAPEAPAAPMAPLAPPVSARPSAPASASAGSRILASPKARRLAREQGLDLARLAEAGHPQPFHVRDLDVLRALPPVPRPGTQAAVGTQATQAASRRLVARIAAPGLRDYVAWAAASRGLTDADAILAGLAAASLPASRSGGVAVAVERHGRRKTYAMPLSRGVSATEPTEQAPDLILRDLRDTQLCSVEMGGEDVPVITLTGAAPGLELTLECRADALGAAEAIALLTELAGRVRDPLRHLL